MEFVAIDEDGDERNWIDPAVDVQEYDDHYEIDNGYGTYFIDKRDGWTYETRPL